MIHPQVNGSPPPHPDMPQDVKENYIEARRIVALSPRSAAALLRLSIENLINDILGDRVKKDQQLYDKIHILVKDGLPPTIQQSLDYLRVIGNNAVHPLGLIDVDDYNTAISLFGLVNLVVENRITNPKKVQGFYDSLPQDIKDNIDKRNGKKE
jgi:hypothetical protein